LGKDNRWCETQLWCSWTQDVLDRQESRGGNGGYCLATRTSNQVYCETGTDL
ncbi:unnamed protein product, partial [Pylaiella littoralis]